VRKLNVQAEEIHKEVDRILVEASGHSRHRTVDWDRPLDTLLCVTFQPAVNQKRSKKPPIGGTDSQRTSFGCGSVAVESRKIKSEK
jgi:hypothetical protein